MDSFDSVLPSIPINHQLILAPLDMEISPIKYNGKSFQLSPCQYYCTVVSTGEKARWELQKDAARCFKQILEAASYKTTAVWPLTSHLTNNQNKMSKICWALLEK